MSTKVLLKKSSVQGKIPLETDLSYGELALNYADGKLYFKDSLNNVKSFNSGIPQLSINDLTDVNTSTTSPSIGQVLKWNGTNWTPADDATVGGAGTNADTLDGFDSSYFLNYNNLTNKPTIPTIPTLVSAFTNDANYVNTTQLATKQATLVSGTNVKTINGQSLLGSGNITISGGSGSSTLSALTDVSIPSPTDGQSLVYNVALGKWTSQDVSSGLYTNTANTTTLDPNQVVDSFAKTQYRTVKYLIQATSASEVHSVEVTLMHNDVNVFATVYNVMFSGAAKLFEVGSSINGTNVDLTVTPLVAGLTIDVTRISLVTRAFTGTEFLWPTDLETQTLTEIDLETQTYPTKDLN